MRASRRAGRRCFREPTHTTGSLTFIEYYRGGEVAGRRNDAAQENQFTFDWSAAALPKAELSQSPPERATLPEPTPEPTPEPEPKTDSIEFRHPDLLQILPWDFRTSFPEPLEEAILNGKLQPEDATPENLKSLHDEHARHALALLSDLDAVCDARRTGVNPHTGHVPRTEKQRETLAKLFKDEPVRLEHAFDTLIDVYDEVFGTEAAEAFRKAIRAWHAGVEVIGENPPRPRALMSAVESGVFGQEEDGSNVDPGTDEAAAITENVTEALMDLQPGPERKSLLAKYGEDFGSTAAEELDRWSQLNAEVADANDHEYDPGHPWHYCERGDGAEPMPVESIPARPITSEQFSVKWPKNPVKRRAAMQQMFASQQKQLAEDETRYQDLIDRGTDALSAYDKDIAHGGDEQLAWASAIALKYNHITGGRGRVQWLSEQLA
jgi:hypothetical protein